MLSVIESIQKRCSVRTYSNRAIEEEKKQKLVEYFQLNCKGPFRNEIRFELVEVGENSKEELKQFGTYGFIKGARCFIAGAVKEGQGSMEDFGYCMEKNILMATALGLGTVWLGGSLKRSTFASKMGVSKGEVIPAVTPLGYAEDKRSMMDGIVRWVAKSKKRKDFGELFFEDRIQFPLSMQGDNGYLTALESVRWAPSASNKQPWRVIKEKGKNNFHFYLNENSKYNHLIKGIKLQNIDMGIAMCHFELSARELGIKGNWVESKPCLDAGDMKYIATWSEEG